MNRSAFHDRSFRLQSLVIHPRFSGHAAVDRWGLLPGSFGIWDLRGASTPAERVSLLSRLLVEDLEMVQPTRVLIGIPRSDGEECQMLRHVVRVLLRRAGVPWDERPVCVAARLMLGKANGHQREELGQRLVDLFFPELRRCLTSPSEVESDRQHERRRYYVNAWYAAALVIHELVGSHPRIVAAMARGDAGNLAQSIAEAHRRLYPSL